MHFAFIVLGFIYFLLLDQTVCQDNSCPDLFQRYCHHHSYCLTPNSSCEILAYYPTEEEITQIVDLHNQKRSTLATGNAGLPSSSNMMEMEWDPELAAVAQQYANRCKYAHDPGNCRRVMNFGVGQNIAIQRLTGGHTIPQADWKFAVDDWFSEIRYFNPNMICNFQPPTSHSEEYRHFSQLSWAKSFRVGCGYVLYKEGNVFKDETYTRLYICNYGPAGNVYGACVYNTGTPCSDCPLNTCCGSGCSQYDGLCRRSSEQPPINPPPQPNLFFCGFRDNDDCDNYIEGDNKWVIEPTLSGNYLGIVLDGGGNSTIVFKKSIKPTSDSFCVVTKYRKGPNKYDDEQASDAVELFYVPEQKYTVKQPLQGYDNPIRQQFSTFNTSLNWGVETQISFQFTVPPGKPTQFFNIKSILAIDGNCQNM
ncbi:spider silk-constituting element SpiCE-CMa2 [Caerostris darwini]|uniref:Spider silk-constituting element SpiCE-CMa2 n=1 Tax=Caerostris darwini TaxID=1538125 RepID=A0AAV4XBE1_9ARAC|nr:spider silk-constituting element SpiCE-CMa2 [Caerostris darwini]